MDPFKKDPFSSDDDASEEEEKNEQIDSLDIELPNPPIAEPMFGEASKFEENPFEALAVTNTSRVKQVWAVGGGKGGIGKSLVASNLAISLARMGNRTVAIDLDLGGANLHTVLGVDLPRQTISDLMSDRVDSLQDCVCPSGIPNLEIISGAQDATGISNIKGADKIKLLQKIRELDADYVIIDLGAGTSLNTVDFFLFSDIGIIVLLPEPTSIENAYRFIKSVYFRRLLLASNLSRVKPLIEMAMDPKNKIGLRSPSDLLMEIKKNDPAAANALKEEVEKFRPKLVINQARTQTDVDIGFSVKSVCKKYFGIDMDYVGYLDYESAVWQAVRRKRPLMSEFPNSKLVSNIERIAHFLLKRHGHHKTGIL